MTDSDSSDARAASDSTSSDFSPASDSSDFSPATDSSDLSSANDDKNRDIEFDTPDTTDMIMSDYPPRNSFAVNDAIFVRKKNQARILLNQDVASSLSENDLDTVSLSSRVTSCRNTSQNYNKCAVVLCSENIRNQFERLFFINFPRDKRNLCEIWWKICGRHDPFNPLSKICSIHFKANDFTSEMVRRDGRLYRQIILKNTYIIPTLYLQPHEYTKFLRKPKNRVKEIRQIPKKSKSVYVCVIQGCKKTSIKHGKSTLFFKFPLQKKYLLKKWLKIIGLPFWKPLKTNRICSDHFENYYITKRNNVYQLNKRAVPALKPKNLFVFNHGDYTKVKFQKPFNRRINPCDFGRLEFNVVDNNTLLVEEKKRKNHNDEKSDILNSLENELDQKLKNYEKILETTTLSNSTVMKNSDKEKQLLIPSTNYNISNVQVISDDASDIQESQSKDKISTSLTKQYLESFEKEIAKEREITNRGDTDPINNIEFEYVYMDIINDVNMNAGVIEVQPTCDTNNSLNEKEVMVKSENNNDIDLEYVYLGMFNDENMIGVQPIYGADISVKDVCDNTDIGFETNNDLKKIIAEPTNNNTAVKAFGTNNNLNRIIAEPTKNNSVVKGVWDNTNIEFESNNNLKKIIAEPTKNNTVVKGVCDNTKIGFGSKNNLKELILNRTKNNTVVKGVCDNTNIGLDTKNNLKKKIVKPTKSITVIKDEYCDNTFAGFGTNNNLKKIIAEPTKNTTVKETPESIIHDQYLTECYGEMLPPYCDSSCELKCYYSVPGPQRIQIFQQFRRFLNVTEQNCEIAQLVPIIMVENAESDFVNCPTYYLKTDKESVNVCRTFFMNTLGIPEHRLDAVLKPFNYSWYTNKHTALKANQPKQAKVISEQMIITDFMKGSLELLDKDYNLFEPESDTEVSLKNVPSKELEKVLLYIKSIPRLVSAVEVPGTLKKIKFETSISVRHMYKTYSEYYIENKIPPPCTKHQFIKIYNQYMKFHLKMV